MFQRVTTIVPVLFSSSISGAKADRLVGDGEHKEAVVIATSFSQAVQACHKKGGVEVIRRRLADTLCNCVEYNYLIVFCRTSY